MRLAAYTVGDITRASSRLRSFYLFSSAEDFSIEVTRPSRYRDALNSEVVHIQKILSIKLFFALIVFRFFGIKVVYDLDDQANSARSSRVISLIVFLGYFLAFALSSVVTVDTDARKKYWQKYYPNKKIIVINDIADTEFGDLQIKNRNSISNHNGFFWLGYASNFHSLAPFLECIKNKEYELTASVQVSQIPLLSQLYPVVKFLPWYDGVAFSDSVSARFMILSHLDDSASLFKSENKMVLAIIAGFIPIVSRTPSYEKLAKLLDAEFLVFDSHEHVLDIVKKLNEAEVGKFFLRAQEILNLNYSKNSVLSSFVENVI